MLAGFQALPRDTELLAFEAGCEEYCEREVDEVEWQGGRVYLHLGARRKAKRWVRWVRRAAAGALRRPRSGSGGRSAPARSRARPPARDSASGQFPGDERPCEAAAGQRGEGLGV
jgi:hypothetical protein